MTTELYFIIDTTHPDFAAIKAAADAFYNAKPQNFSWFTNLDGTKAEAKIVGDSDDWYETSAWFGHPCILGVYSRNPDDQWLDHNDLRTLLGTPEWHDPMDDIV